MESEEYAVRTAGHKPLEIIVSPGSYPGITAENLRRAEAMIRETLIVPPENYKIHSKDHGNAIGVTSCLVVRPGDDIVYAKLKGRDIYGKFVRGRQPEPCSHLTIIIKVVKGKWRLIRVFIGEHAPAFPGDPNAARASGDFWATRALILDTIPLDQQNRHLLTRCPW